MLYDLKIVLDGNEIFDVDDGTSPYIADLKYTNCATSREMEIGACASDSISFVIKNTSTETYDGSVAELYVHPHDGSALDGLAEIEESVGDSTDGEDVDPSEIESIYAEDESGEDMTPEEIAESEIVEANDTVAEFNFFQGEDLESEEVETDEGEEEEWTKLGTFHVYHQTNSVNDNSITLICYDGMAKLTGTYIPTNRKASAQAIYDDICSQITDRYGIVCDPETMPQIDIDWTLTCSLRDAYGYMAGLVGGYAMIGADDTLGIDYYTYNDTILLDTDVNAYSETSGGEMVVGAVECDRGINQSDIISVGAGQAIKFSNPFVDDNRLSVIYDMYKSVRYTGADATINWHDGILAGQFVRIMTAEEYANYVAYSNAYAEAIDDATTSDEEILEIKSSMNYLGKVILICSQTVDFSGNAKSMVKSIGVTEYAKENPAPSPVDARFRNLYAEMIEAEYLRAKGAYIADLAADNFTVGSINGNAITNGTILAQALSSEAVQTLGGTHVYYQALEPTDGVKAGDVWYHTVVSPDEQSTWTDNVSVYNGTAWVTTPLDATMFRAGSITANEIASGTITAGNINMDSLQTNIGRIGSTGGSYILIDNDSIDLMYDNEKQASFEMSVFGSDITFVHQSDVSTLSPTYCTVIKNTVNGKYQSSLLAGDLQIDSPEGSTDIFGGDITASGTISGKLNGNFVTEPYVVVNSKSIAAEGYSDGTTSLSKAGYYPLSVSGWSSGTRYWSLNRAYFTNQSVGSATLNWMVANHHSSAHSASMTVYVLWVRA